MANDSKRISELGITATLSANDRVVVLTRPDTAANAQTITLTNLGYSLTQNVIPIANSSQLGLIKIGDGLAVAANGVVTAPLPVATTSSYGVVKVGNNLSINTSGFLSATTNTGDIVFHDHVMTINPSSANDIVIYNSTGAVLSLSNVYSILLYSTLENIYESDTLSYSLVSSDGVAQYARHDDPNNNTYSWSSKSLDSYGNEITYGIYSDNNVSYSYGFSISPNANTYGYGLNINPSGGFNNTLTILPTGDYDIHLYESFFNGAITLGNYGQTNFRVYGPGGANNGGGQYGNDIRADLAANSTFRIKTYDTQDHVWQFNPNGSVTGDFIPASDNTYSLGNTTNQWKSLHVSGNTIYIDRVPLAARNGSIYANNLVASNLFDELGRPFVSPDALDINADCGTALAVYSPSDIKFDGGATHTVFSKYEACLDGGASYSNKHSVSYIDGGGANQL